MIDARTRAYLDLLAQRFDLGDREERGLFRRLVAVEFIDAPVASIRALCGSRSRTRSGASQDLADAYLAQRTKNIRDKEETMNFLNLTPHAITIRREDGTEIHVPASGTVARVVMRETVVSVADGVPYVSRVAGEVIGLPKHADGIDDTTIPVLVSSMVLAAVPGRPNTYAPDTGATAIRDASGHVVAVTRLVCA